MKKLLLVGLMTLSIQAFAQNTQGVNRLFQKRTWLVGLQTAFAKGNLNTRNTTKNDLIFQAFGGYFVVDKLLIGLSGTYMQQQQPLSFQIITPTLGPIVRYQFTQTRVSPYLTASFQIGRGYTSGILQVDGPNGTKITPTYTTGFPTYTRSFGAGLSISAVSRFRVDAALHWQDMVDTPNVRFGYGSYQAQAGITYQIGGKE
ncbi:hypothetical protein [Spirosoma gilvum]